VVTDKIRILTGSTPTDKDKELKSLYTTFKTIAEKSKIDPSSVVKFENNSYVFDVNPIESQDDLRKIFLKVISKLVST
jgi:hypothetical protein